MLQMLNNIAKPSLRLIKYGVIGCIIFLSSVTVVFALNLTSPGFSYMLDFLCKTAAVTAVYMFAEIIIGGLFMDIYQKRHSS